jgi:1,2-diacylglycerol 3-beta-galactosyltransferase
MARQILILTSDAGFGHRRAAEAIEAAIKETYGDRFQVTIANPLQDPDIPSLLKRLETGYDEMVTDDPTLYQIAYTATDAPVVVRLIQDVTTTVLNNTLTELVAVHLPELIITTHPAFIQAAIRASKNLSRAIPVGVVVTDLIGVHSLWFHHKATQTCVPTEQVYNQAIEHGLDRDRVTLTGLPVHPAFMEETREPAEIRRALGWEPEMTTALIVGSPRTTRTADITRLLDRSGLPLQLVAVAGGNTETEERLRSTEWSGTVHVYGLVRNMPEMVHAADFIICKAGGLIVTEALACGVPPLLFEALPGQEAGNARFVVESGAGAWSPGPIGVLTTAYAWLAKDAQELKMRQAAARRVGRPRAAYHIAELLVGQIE